MWDDERDRPHLVDLPTDGRTGLEPALASEIG